MTATPPVPPQSTFRLETCLQTGRQTDSSRKGRLLHKQLNWNRPSPSLFLSLSPSVSLSLPLSPPLSLSLTLSLYRPSLTAAALLDCLNLPHAWVQSQFQGWKISRLSCLSLNLKCCITSGFTPGGCKDAKKMSQI